MDFNVLLISCYELGHQPLGLASPSAHLLSDGHSVQCLDLSTESFDEEKIRNASLIGISVPMHTAIRLGMKVVDRVRSINKDCHISFYGLYASLNGDYLLKSGADSVIGGEFEEGLRSLSRDLAGNRVECSSGVRTRSNWSGPSMDRQRFRAPARHLLPPLERYARLEWRSVMKLVGAVEASRGCAHRCLHCPVTPVYQGRIRIVQEEIVLADIENLVRMGAGHINFCDPDFLNGVEHSMRIVRRMHDSFPHLSFDFTAKIEHLLEYDNLIPTLKELGCIFIQSAVESLNDTILEKLEKGHTRADVLKALNVTRSAGIALRPSFVSFTPWTTLEDYLDVIEFIETNNLIYHVDPVQLAIRLLLPPESSLLGTPQILPYIRSLNAEKFSYEWKHADPRMEGLGEKVSKIVERAVEISEDPMITFHEIKTLAGSLAGRTFPARDDLPPCPKEDRPPRLTESWFCCAEPTEDQLLPITSRSQGAVV